MNMMPEQALYTGSLPQSEPAVTRAEIAAYFAEQVAPAYAALARTRGRASLYVVENRYGSFHFDLTLALGQLLGYPTLYHVVQARQGEGDIGEEGLVASWDLVVALINQNKTSLMDIYERAVNLLSHGKDMLLVCDSSSQLPRVLTELAGGVVRVSRFDPASVADACSRFYDLKSLTAIDAHANWARHVLPEDFLINSEAKDDPLPAIRESVLARLQPYRCDDARPLDALRAMAEARDWARNWAADVHELLNGNCKVRWQDVEHGAALVGSQGMGKTTFARALARATGMHLIEASMAAGLHTPAEQGGPAAYFSGLLARAENLSPVLLFIESDGYQVTGLERLFDGFDPENPVFVLVAAEEASLIDKALLRHGRIEAVLHIPIPTASVLKDVFAELLETVGSLLNEQDLDSLGRMAQGNVMTLVDAEKIVRQAHRAARRKSHLLSLADLSQAIFSTPGAYRLQRSETQIEDTAYHEAGHAVMSLLMANQGRDLTYLTVVPRDYAYGFAARSLEESGGSATREAQLEEIRMALGGRAAEEIRKGKENVSYGCSQDIKVATSIATMMLTRWAFGDRHPLVSRDVTVDEDAELRREVGELLDEQYRKTLEMLGTNWALVKKLAEAVMAAEELTGDEVRGIYAGHLGGAG